MNEAEVYLNLIKSQRDQLEINLSRALAENESMKKRINELEEEVKLLGENGKVWEEKETTEE